jgi:hypothetical protein
MPNSFRHLIIPMVEVDAGEYASGVLKQVQHDSVYLLQSLQNTKPRIIRTGARVR